ncbi:MAG: PTS sugar transporter subunit IIA [Candidatus Hydrogenedentes bacterium]|nr:PTS sugar transporter subunit IIA [Candidatus Hydrogenedentota bacterium]
MSVFGIDIDETQVVLLSEPVTKQAALDQLVAAVAEHESIEDSAALRRAVHEREAVMSTGIGGGIAIPHVRIPEVKSPVLGVGISPQGIDYGTLDGNPVHILILFATPATADKEYLNLLARVMMALRNRTLYDHLVSCRSPREIFETLRD